MGVLIHSVCILSQEISAFVMAAQEKKKIRQKNLDLQISLQHEEWHTFTPPGSSEKQSHFGNVYYHCSVSCVMAIWVTSIPSGVIVPMEVKSKLLPEHKHFIYATFGVSVM